MATNTNITIMINGEDTKREIFIRQHREFKLPDPSEVNLNKVYLSELFYDYEVIKPFRCCNVKFLPTSQHNCGHHKADGKLAMRSHKQAGFERKFTSRKECPPRGSNCKLFYNGSSKPPTCKCKLTTNCRCCVCSDDFLIPSKSNKSQNNIPPKYNRSHTPLDPNKYIAKGKWNEDNPPSTLDTFDKQRNKSSEDFMSPWRRNDSPSALKSIDKLRNKSKEEIPLPPSSKRNNTPSKLATFDKRISSSKKSDEFFPSWKSENNIRRNEIHKTESFPNIRLADRIANLNTGAPHSATSLEDEKERPPQKVQKAGKSKKKLNRCASIGAVTDLKFRNGKLLKSSKTLSMFELRPDGWVYDNTAPRHEIKLGKNKLNLDNEVNDIHSTNMAAILAIGNIKVIF